MFENIISSHVKVTCYHLLQQKNIYLISELVKYFNGNETIIACPLGEMKFLFSF